MLLHEVILSVKVAVSFYRFEWSVRRLSEWLTDTFVFSFQFSNIVLFAKVRAIRIIGCICFGIVREESCK